MERANGSHGKEQQQQQQASLEELHLELLAQVASHLDPDSRGALRQCSQKVRAAVDMAARHLRAKFTFAPRHRPPELIELLVKSFAGLVGRGGRPHSLTLTLEEDDVDQKAKGLAVLGSLSAAQSLTELHLHCLPLTSPEIVERITAAAPGLTKLILSGSSRSPASLQSGLGPLLRVAHALAYLKLLDLDRVAAVEALPWQDLREQTALTSLNLKLASQKQQPWDAAAAEALGRGLAGLTQLRSLELDDSCVDGGQHSARAVLSAICPALSGLQTVTLRLSHPPEDLLQRLASLPQLENLSVAASYRRRDVKDVSYLRQLTALTSLHLTAALSPAGIQRAIASSPDRRSWALPPQLQSLRLDAPLSLQHLAAMNPPQTLRHVRLSSEPIELPGPVEQPGVAVLLVQALVRKLAGKGVEELALLSAPTADGRGLRNPQWAAREHGSCLAALGPLQLRRLELHGLVLDGAGAEALAGALGGCLQELKLVGCEISAGRTLPALLGLRCLRGLVVWSANSSSPQQEDLRVPGQTASQMLAHCLEVVVLKREMGAGRVEAAAALHKIDTAVEAIALMARGTDSAADAVVAQRALLWDASLRKRHEPAAVACTSSTAATTSVPLLKVLAEAALLLLAARGVSVDLRCCNGEVASAGRAAQQQLVRVRKRRDDISCGMVWVWEESPTESA